jgi:hypothetical protein
VVDAYVVDEVGGEAANMLAMYGAWRNLAAAQPDFVLIDGKGLPKVPHPAVVCCVAPFAKPACGRQDPCCGTHAAVVPPAKCSG